MSDSDRYVLSVLLDVHIKDGPYADTIATSHVRKTMPWFGFNCEIKCSFISVVACMDPHAGMIQNNNQ